MKHTVESLVKQWKPWLISKLDKLGIQECITVKIKAFNKVSQKDWLALYRSGTQFQCKPIFWINPNFMKFIGNECPNWSMRTTLSHEYGHVIHEWATWRSNINPHAREALSLIHKIGDMETYCEDFAQWMEANYLGYAWHQNIVELFRIQEPIATTV